MRIQEKRHTCIKVLQLDTESPFTEIIEGQQLQSKPIQNGKHKFPVPGITTRIKSLILGGGAKTSCSSLGLMSPYKIQNNIYIYIYQENWTEMQIEGNNQSVNLYLQSAGGYIE